MFSDDTAAVVGHGNADSIYQACGAQLDTAATRSVPQGVRKQGRQSAPQQYWNRKQETLLRWRIVQGMTGLSVMRRKFGHCDILRFASEHLTSR